MARKIEVQIVGDASKLNSELKGAQNSTKRFGTATKVAAGIVAGGIVVALKSSVSAAMESEKATMRLNQAFDSAKVSAKERQKAQEAVNKVSKRAALDDEDLSDVLAKLTRSTGSVKDATEGMSLAAEIARGRNVSLEQAAKGVEKAYLGQETGLKRLGIVVPKVDDAYKAVKDRIADLQDQLKGAEGPQKAAIEAAIENEKKQLDNAKALDKAATAQNALKAAQEKFAGSSEEFGETAAGAHERFQVAVENLQEKIGMALLPALTDLTAAGVKAVEWLEENDKVAKALVITIGALTAALVLAKGAQLAMNLAVLANPYVAAGLAVAALAAGLVVLWQKVEQARPAIVLLGTILLGLPAAFLLAWQASETFQKIVTGALDKVEAAALKVKDVFVWLKDHGGEAWAALGTKLTGPVGALVGIFTALWQKLDPIIGAFKWLVSHAGDLGGAFGGILGVVKSGADKLSDGDPFSPSMLDPRSGPFTGNLHGALPVMGPFAASAARYGLTLTSGKDDHAKYTNSGTISDHWYGKAIDVSNGVNTPQMAAYFRSLIGNPRVKEAFYDPVGSIFGGILSSYRQGGHSNHVHVATYDQGGWLQPGWTLAHNGTGMPERVGGGGNVYVTVNAPNYVGSTRELADAVQVAARQFQRDNGRSLV